MGRSSSCNCNCECCEDALLIWTGWPLGSYGQTIFQDLNGSHPITNGGSGRRYDPVTPTTVTWWVEYDATDGWVIKVLHGDLWTFKATEAAYCNRDNTKTIFEFDSFQDLNGYGAIVDATNVAAEVQWCVDGPPPACNCLCAPEVTLGNLSGLPAIWQTALSGTHKLTGERGFDLGGDGICRYAKTLSLPFVIPMGDCEFAGTTNLVLAVAIDWATGDTITTLGTTRTVNTPFFVGPDQISHSANFTATWAGSAPAVCSESYAYNVGDLAETFVSQTAEPDCSGEGTGGWKQKFDLLGNPTGCWDFCDWSLQDNSVCFSWPPDYTPDPADTACQQTTAEWLFRELVGVDFSVLTASMTWIDCDGT